MLFELAMGFVTLIFLGISSYCDIRTREVPDWLSYGLIFAGMGLRGIFAVEQGWQVLASGFLGLGAAIIVAYLLYFSNQWGGGDSKLLMGMGAVLGIHYPWSSSSWYLLWFFLLLLLSGGLWGLVWMVAEAIRRRDQFLQQWKLLISEYQLMHCGAVLITLPLLGMSWKLPFLWPLAILPLALFYLILFVVTVERSCFVKNRRPAQLTEGDWLAEQFYYQGKRVLARKSLTHEDILLLRSLQKKGKLRQVLIREGVPLVPGFFLAYGLLAFGKEWLLVVLQKFFW